LTANRDELIPLIEGLPDDRVDVLLAAARRLAAGKPYGTWPPKFVGMSKDGPSSPEHIAAFAGAPRCAVVARLRQRARCDAQPGCSTW